MIALCTHCRTLNDFTAEPLDTCWKCGATNITNQNFKIYSKVSKRETKPQIQYPKPKGTCSRCKRKNMTLYSVKNKLCQNCYRVDLERRKSEKLKRRIG